MPRLPKPGIDQDIHKAITAPAPVADLERVGVAAFKGAIETMRGLGITRDFAAVIIYLPGKDGDYHPWLTGSGLCGLAVSLPDYQAMSFQQDGRDKGLYVLDIKLAQRPSFAMGFRVQQSEAFIVRAGDSPRLIPTSFWFGWSPTIAFLRHIASQGAPLAAKAKK